MRASTRSFVHKTAKFHRRIDTLCPDPQSFLWWLRGTERLKQSKKNHVSVVRNSPNSTDVQPKCKPAICILPKLRRFRTLARRAQKHVTTVSFLMKDEPRPHGQPGNRSHHVGVIKDVRVYGHAALQSTDQLLSALDWSMSVRDRSSTLEHCRKILRFGSC